MPGSLRFGRFTRVARVSRVDVHVHWTVFAAGAAILAGTISKPLPTIVGLTAYLAVLVIHESGHLLMARRRGYKTLSMAIYPLFGLAYFESPRNRMDRAMIAWGGVLAQAIVAVPFVL